MIALRREVVTRAAAQNASVVRQPWIDNLRVAVIAAVIVVHVSATYAVQMPWYYEERTASFVTQAILSALFGPGVFYAMAVLFLMAGTLAPRSLERKGVARFVLDRLLRLGIPLAVGVVAVVPLAGLLGALAEGGGGMTGVGAFAADRVRDLDFGPMWFVAALLVFSIAYAALRWTRPGPHSPHAQLSGWHLAGAVAAIAVGSFAVRLAWPALSVTPGHLNLWEWPSMATLFWLGVVAGEQGWLDPVPDRWRQLCGWVGLAALIAATLFFATVAITGDDRLLGGWHGEALVGPLIEGVLAVTVSIWLFAWFRRRWNRSGPVGRAAGRASYAAYVFHPIVVVLAAAALRAVPVAAELKFVVVAAAGVVASLTLGSLLTQFTPFRRIF